MKNSIETVYNKQYKDISFERSGLFDLISKEYNCKTVLYPGCSIHITPSFYFDHVVYVDNSQLAIDFFRHREKVDNLIKKYKTYKKSCFFEFLPMDFQENLGLLEGSFDMLISIFSGKQISYCSKYIRKNGIILTNSFFSDNESIENCDKFQLLCTITCRNGKYIKSGIEHQKGKNSQSKLTKSNSGFKYKDNETYDIYRKKF